MEGVYCTVTAPGIRVQGSEWRSKVLGHHVRNTMYWQENLSRLFYLHKSFYSNSLKPRIHRECTTFWSPTGSFEPARPS